MCVPCPCPRGTNAPRAILGLCPSEVEAEAPSLDSWRSGIHGGCQPWMWGQTGAMSPFLLPLGGFCPSGPGLGAGGWLLESCGFSPGPVLVGKALSSLQTSLQEAGGGGAWLFPFFHPGGTRQGAVTRGAEWPRPALSHLLSPSWWKSLTPTPSLLPFQGKGVSPPASVPLCSAVVAAVGWPWRCHPCH